MTQYKNISVALLVFCNLAQIYSNNVENVLNKALLDVRTLLSSNSIPLYLIKNVNSILSIANSQVVSIFDNNCCDCEKTTIFTKIKLTSTTTKSSTVTTTKSAATTTTTSISRAKPTTTATTTTTTTTTTTKTTTTTITTATTKTTTTTTTTTKTSTITSSTATIKTTTTTIKITTISNNNSTFTFKGKINF